MSQSQYSISKEQDHSSDSSTSSSPSTELLYEYKACSGDELDTNVPKRRSLYYKTGSSLNSLRYGSPCKLLVLHITIFFIYTFTFFAVLLHMRLASSDLNGSARKQSSSTSGVKFYSPIDNAMDYRVETLHNSVNATNKYKGPPTPEVEKAWMDLFRYSEIRLTSEDLAKMNRSSVELADGTGDYVGTPDTYHQLHCLWYLFKNLHPEYWVVEPTQVPIMEHVDHCIDSLRQFIQCHATTSIQTYSWIPELRIPWANFEVDNICVDWDTYDNWMLSHTIDIYAPDSFIHPTLGPSFPGGLPRTHDHHVHGLGGAV